MSGSSGRASLPELGGARLPPPARASTKARRTVRLAAAGLSQIGAPGEGQQEPGASRFVRAKRASWHDARAACACKESAALLRLIEMRGQLVKILQVAGGSFSGSHSQMRTVGKQISELRAHTLLLVAGLQAYQASKRVGFALQTGGAQYVWELAADLEWLDEPSFAGMRDWLGMNGTGNPMLLPRLLSGRPLGTKKPRPEPANDAKTYKPFIQPGQLREIKAALQYLRAQLKQPKVRQRGLSAGDADQWVELTLHEEKAPNVAAEALLLQRCWRGHKARCEVANLKAMLRHWRSWRECHAAHQLRASRQGYLGRSRAVRTRAAMAMQRYWRGFSSRRLAVETKAAVLLERCWRGHRDRHIVARARAALTVQRCWRGHALRSKGPRRTRKRSALDTIAEQRRAAATMVSHARSAAALVLQRCWRGKAARDCILKSDQFLARLQRYLSRLVGEENCQRLLPKVVEQRLSASDLRLLSRNELSNIGFPVVDSVQSPDAS